jgi:hypothetical protein
VQLTKRSATAKVPVYYQVKTTNKIIITSICAPKKNNLYVQGSAAKCFHCSKLATFWNQIHWSQ